MVDGLSIATNNSWHKGGRVWILWNPTIFLLDFYDFSAQCINMKVTEVASTTQFFVSMLINFASLINGPWMAAGDFNCVLSHTERLGGTSTDAEIDEFQSCLDACGLVDSPAQGAYYMWNNKQDASTRVFSRLDRGTKMFQVVRKLKLLKVHLRQFNKDHFADIENAAALALRNLEAIQTKLIDYPSNQQMLVMETQAAEEYKKLQADCNLNQVLSVKDNKGQEHAAPQAVKEAFLKYYKELLGTDVHTDKVNFQIIKRGRTVIGDEVCAAVQDVFNSGKLLKQLNATTVTLIPKCKMPTYVHQFRPIACCNVLYKCISKILCNSLALVLPELIRKNQGGFIKWRSILENIMVCQDLVRLYNRQACSARCMFKMNLMKAYDSVTWEFLAEILDAFNFPASFRRLIMECVSSATYTLSLNGDNFGFFPGKRGLRQGDPMSPLLFTLCMEYLTRIIDCATEKLPFHFHPLCKSMRLTHLMFADDLLLFCKGDAQKDILSVSGIKEGTLPFKYLGVPITAGRLVLVRVVLSTMSSYWASLFVLPKGVINRVDSICRNFLWEGSTEHNKAPLLALYKVCVPQKDGGLGLRVSTIWNIATIGKLVSWLSVKPDKLWVQWHWRKVCHVRDTIKEGFSDGVWSIGVGDYSVKSCYSWLREKRPVVDWHRSVWNVVSPPKHCFIAWLISSHALMLKEKLVKLQISTDDKCCICALATESHAHLFQECSFSHKIYSSLAVKLGARLDATNQLQCIRKKRWSRLRKQVTTAILLAAWYLIWNQRNEARLFFTVSRPELIAEQAWRVIHTRIRVLSPKFINDNDKLWLSRVHLM
ncbi:uncharacterized protein LOC141627603 [Silene latifolia]|uniref:uncharacterized protein LOC141627603 n=1 Tax=Silene latifolia TaxID=37657 RepID=UPI003D77F6BD